MAKQGRVGMSLWDRLVLLVAWILTCGLVYVLGIYVGKGTQEHRLGIEDRVVRLPVASTPPAEGQRPKGESELRFYDTLMAGTAPEARTDARAAKPSPAAAAKPAIPSPTQVAPKPAVAAVAATRGPSTTLPAAAPRSAARIPAEAPPRAATATRPPVDLAPAVPATARTPSPGTSPAGEVRLPSIARTGGWTVQANPTRSREEAEGIQRQLHGRGYEASIVRVLRDGDTWYRVQVGHFATSEQATEVMQRLREREGVSHAFVASE